MKKVIENFIELLKMSRYMNSSEMLDDFNNTRIKNITFDEIFEKFGNGDKMNFFPSENKGSCCEIAMFVSFHKPIFDLKFKTNQMVSLDDVLKKLVQQVLGTCYPTNQKIILITDKIDTDIFEPWLGNLKAVKKLGMEIDIVYIKSSGDYKMINDLLGL